MNQVWVMVHYAGADDMGFEIVPQERLIDSSWDVLQKGVWVSLMCGNFKCRAKVIHVNDDIKYIESNFNSLREEFLDCRRNQEIEKLEELRQEQLEVKDDNEICQQGLPFKCVSCGFDNNPIGAVTVTSNSSTSTAVENAIRPENQPMKRKLLARYYKELEERSDEQVNYREIKQTTNKEVHYREMGKKINQGVDYRETEEKKNEEHEVVYIGPGKTIVPRTVFQTINWDNYSGAARKLLTATFDRETLATHSLTGKPSPAFLGANKPPKLMLDAVKVEDIVDTVARKCDVPRRFVRSAITTKCADENKMFKRRLLKENCTPVKSNDS